MKSPTDNSVEVSLRIGGQNLTEFDVPEEQHDESMAMTKYVEATTGAHFKVVCRYNGTYVPTACDGLDVAVTIDGEEVQKSLFSVKYKRIGKVKVRGRTFNISGSAVCEKFRFSRLELVDEPTKLSASQSKVINNLGEIRVAVAWYKRMAVTRLSEEKDKYTPVFASGVHETKLKGRSISNQISLDEAVPKHSSPRRVRKTQAVNGAPPRAVFVFRYRSKRDLQCEGVIPRSPSPVALEDRNPDELTPDELRQAMRSLQESREAEQRVKRERMNNDRSEAVHDQKRRRTIEHIDLVED